jgi:ATP adenylyltransferase
MDRLWSPWRLPYVTGSKPDVGCIFCAAARAIESDPLVVFKGAACYIIVNLYPYNNGHLMVVPFRHVPSFAALSIDEVHETANLIQRAELALTEAYQPHGINIGVNLGKSAGAGVLDHVHVHVVPRWSGDTNFMTVIGDARVLPEDLHASVERLRPIFQRLSTAAS